MSDQGAIHEGAIGSGAGVETRTNPPDVGSPEFSGQEAPAWLAPIEARMDELRDQNAAIAERLQGGYEALEDDGYYDDDGELTADELAALGLDPDELDAIAGERERGDVFDWIEQSVDGRLAAQEIEQGIEQRDEDYEALKAQYPMLQDDRTAYAIVQRAQRLAEHFDPEVIDSPEFVGLIEATLKAHMMERVNGGEPIEQVVKPPAVQLESAAGAAGAMIRDRTPNEPDWGSRIVEAANKLRPRI